MRRDEKKGPTRGKNESGVLAKQSTGQTGGGGIAGRDLVTVYVGGGVGGGGGGGNSRQSGSQEGLGSRVQPFLPYLTDRRDQDHSLRRCLEQRMMAGCRRPVIAFVLGSDDDSIDTFAPRLEVTTLIEVLKASKFPSVVIRKSLRWSNSPEEIREETLYKLSLSGTADSREIATLIKSSGASYLFQVGISIESWREETAA